MKFEQQLKELDQQQIWNYYCGFLNYTTADYMQVQTRLMEEQIESWSNSDLGQSILCGKKPSSIDEFRTMVPLTTYDDYADVLLAKRSDSLPMNPVVWIETTWEGGIHPVKVAPYSRSMLDIYTKNIIACLILGTSSEKNTVNVTVKDKMLYGLAPLPYATGLLPLGLKEELPMTFLPDPIEANTLSFSERNKLGFKMALRDDVELFFGVGSVAYAVTKNLVEASSSSSKGVSSLLKYSPKRAAKILKAKKLAKQENRAVYPKDLFNLKGIMIAGTDNRYYKDDLEKLWGIRPMEVFAGTEGSVVGVETWTRDGMYFFPDTNFYEFIKEEDYMRLMDQPTYQPQTYLMNEVVPGNKYELVITVLKGGAFARYRVGDVYECVGLQNKEDGTSIPRFHYVDRTPNIIDIAGFTRISEYSIDKAIEHSKVKVIDWIARKEVSDSNRPFLKLYVEIDQDYLTFNPMSPTILKELLTTYFKYLDHDYKDLKKILGMDPLVVELLPVDAFKKYKKSYSKPLRRFNASHHDVLNLLSACDRR